MAKAEKPNQKTKTAPSKKTQYGRFVEIARQLGCDESEDTFEQTFKKIVPPKRTASKV
jgi:hypothetical protein